MISHDSNQLAFVVLTAVFNFLVIEGLQLEALCTFISLLFVHDSKFFVDSFL